MSGTGVIPEAQDKHHFSLEGLSHSLNSSQGSLVIFLLVLLFLGFNTRISNGSSRNSLAILNISPLDLNKIASFLAVVSDELGLNSEWLGGIDGKVAAWAEKGMVSISVRVYVGSIHVTLAFISVSISSAVDIVIAWSESRLFAHMGGHLGSFVIGFPDIKFSTARACLIEARNACSFAINKLNVSALGITVAQANRGRIARAQIRSAIKWHLDKVDGPIESASSLAHVSLKAKLPAQHVEANVFLAGGVSDIHPAANIGAVLVLGDVVHGQRVAIDMHSIVSAPLVSGHSLNGASLPAGVRVRAHLVVPAIGVAVLVHVSGGVDPVPVAVKDQFACNQGPIHFQGERQQVVLVGGPDRKTEARAHKGPNDQNKSKDAHFAGSHARYIKNPLR